MTGRTGEEEGNENNRMGPRVSSKQFPLKLDSQDTVMQQF